MAFRLVSICFGIAISLTQVAIAQLETKQLSQSGLTMHWHASIGGTGLRNGDSSLTLWTSQVGKAEVVSVLIKVPENASVQQLQSSSLRVKLPGEEGKPASFIKLSEAERMPPGQELEIWKILEQFNTGDNLGNQSDIAADSPQGKLGSSGAREMAESLAKTYRALKRDVEIISESRESSYLVTLNKNGLLTNIDAETGKIYWQSQLPYYNLNTFGPGVSDEYVAVINGNHLLVYGLEFGNLVSTQRLQFVPTGKILIWQDRVLVPSAGGRIVSYNGVNVIDSPTVVRLGLENRKTLTQSNDSRFFGWITDSRLVVAKHDELPKLWTSVDAETSVPGNAVAVNDGFLFLSEFGTMIRTNFSSTNPISWRRKFGTPTGSSPVVGPKHAAFVSQNGLLIVADLESGLELWGRPLGGMSKVLNLTATRAYVMDQAGKLAIIEIETGRILNRIPAAGFLPLANNINDRILLISELGELICLREIDSETPAYTTTKVVDPDGPQKPSGTTVPEKSPGESSSSGSSPFETEKATSEQAVFDPFAG